LFQNRRKQHDQFGWCGHLLRRSFGSNYAGHFVFGASTSCRLNVLNRVPFPRRRAAHFAAANRSRVMCDIANHKQIAGHVGRESRAHHAIRSPCVEQKVDARRGPISSTWNDGPGPGLRGEVEAAQPHRARPRRPIEKCSWLLKCSRDRLALRSNLRRDR
jgi:hypothetical protein